MSQSSGPSPDEKDRNVLHLVGFTFTITLMLAVEAIQMRVEASTSALVLEYTHLILKGIMIVYMILLITFKLRILRKVLGRNFSRQWSPDSFTSAILKKALTLSWATTFIVLSWFMRFGETDNGSTEFYFKITLCMMLGVFSGAFLVLYLINSDFNKKELH